MSKGADEAVRDLGRRRQMDLDYEKQDAHEAERLIRLARLKVSDDDRNAEAKRKAVESAREELEQLGLDPDDVARDAGVPEVAALVNRRRINTDLREADEMLERGTGFLGGVERGGFAFEKGFVELPLIWMQVAAGLVTGDSESARARIATASETAKDVWKLLANRDVDTVATAGHRLAQSTLGAASLEVTDEERLLGEDPRLQLARELSLGVGEGTIAVHRVVQLVAGLKGLVQAAAGAPAAGAALARSIRGVWSGTRALAGRAVEGIRTLRSSLGNRLGIRAATGGGIPPVGVGGAAEETATLYRSVSPSEWLQIREGIVKGELRADLQGTLLSNAQRKGLATEPTLLRRLLHPIDLPDLRGPSPFVSLTTMPHVAQDYAGVLIKVAVPRSALLKAWRVSNAEYLVQGGTRIVSAEAVAGAMPSLGATARWAGEVGAATGVLGVGGGYIVSEVGERIIEAQTPDYTEPGK